MNSELFWDVVYEAMHLIQSTGSHSKIGAQASTKLCICA